MKDLNLPSEILFKDKLFFKLKKLFFFLSLLFVSHSNMYSQVSLEGSWGVTFPIFGGERMDNEIDNNEKDYLSGAQEIVDELPTAGHVITNLSYFAHSYYFNTRSNANVDVANEIHPAMVPSIENDGVAVDAINIMRNSGKKIILYISTNYMVRATDEIKAAWLTYYTDNFGGNEYLAYKDLIQGFIEEAKGYADGYWLDTTNNLRDDGYIEDFIRMIRETDPTALITWSGGVALEQDGVEVLVDSDGTGDEDPSDYYIKLHEAVDDISDYTNGHIVPFSTGAPPNSWGYEEFMIPNMMVQPIAQFNDKSVQKHGWFPIRDDWHSPQKPILFDTEQAYRYVRRITDYGGSITFANTNQTPRLGDGRAGHMMADEMVIMKEVNRRLLLNPVADYVPYTRPEGATLVGETQYIEFPDIPIKNVGDADFIAATATSGLEITFTSSNTGVATIVDGKVHIVGGGTTTITATQAGNGTTYTAAVDAMRPLRVASISKLDQTITFNSLPTKEVSDNPFSPGATASSGLLVSYTSSNPDVAVIAGANIHIIGSGTTTITASQVGDFAYNPASEITSDLTVVDFIKCTNTNLASCGVATQSSTLVVAGIASKAVDGNTSGVWSEGSVTHTNDESNSWWQVDLGGDYSIGDIKIFNRTDCCTERLSNFTVFVIDSDGTTTYQETITTEPSPSVTINAGDVQGKIVKIMTNLIDTGLTIAEVEVYEGTVLSTTETILSSKINIYPNPTDNRLSINLVSIQKANYTIINHIGQEILSASLSIGSNLIDVSNLSPGFYLVRISDNNKIYTKKIIKN